MLGVLLKGLALGLVAGLPLGPASAAVADTAIRKSISRALAVGLGGALVDLAYCLAVVAGLGAVFEHSPDVQRIFLGAGGAVLIVFWTLTATRPALHLADPHHARPIEARTFFRYLATGVFISVANPALAVSWVLLAGTVLADRNWSEGLAGGIGVFLGVFVWFAIVAQVSHRGRLTLGPRAIWIPRVAGLLLIAYGAFLLGRVGLAWALGL